MEVDSNPNDGLSNSTDETTIISETNTTPFNTSNSMSIKSEAGSDLRERILNHIAGVSGIHFKSQQLGEPELSFDVKRNIVEEVLNRSYATFLSRFGLHLLPEHLPYFDNPPECETYEVHFYVNQLKSTQCKPATKVSRYTARVKVVNYVELECPKFSQGMENIYFLTARVLLSL